MNGCPCGFFTNPKKKCPRTPIQIQRYMSKISGPLLDRINLHLEVPALSSTELLSNTQSENSRIVKTRMLEARGRQQKRFADAGITANSHMNHRQIKKSRALDTEGKKLLKAAIDELGFSAWAYDKILKVANHCRPLRRGKYSSCAHCRNDPVPEP